MSIQCYKHSVKIELNTFSTFLVKYTSSKKFGHASTFK